MDTSHVWLLSLRVMVPCPISLLQHFSVHPNAISAGRERVGTGAKLREISLWTELKSTWKAPSHTSDEDYETLEKDCNDEKMCKNMKSRDKDDPVPLYLIFHSGVFLPLLFHWGERDKNGREEIIALNREKTRQWENSGDDEGRNWMRMMMYLPSDGYYPFHSLFAIS